jgi:hypothetical protein
MSEAKFRRGQPIRIEVNKTGPQLIKKPISVLAAPKKKGQQRKGPIRHRPNKPLIQIGDMGHRIGVKYFFLDGVPVRRQIGCFDNGALLITDSNSPTNPATQELYDNYGGGGLMPFWLSTDDIGSATKIDGINQLLLRSRWNLSTLDSLPNLFDNDTVDWYSDENADAEPYREILNRMTIGIDTIANYSLRLGFRLTGGTDIAWISLSTDNSGSLTRPDPADQLAAITGLDSGVQAQLDDTKISLERERDENGSNYLPEFFGQPFMVLPRIAPGGYGLALNSDQIYYEDFDYLDTDNFRVTDTPSFAGDEVAPAPVIIGPRSATPVKLFLVPQYWKIVATGLTGAPTPVNPSGTTPVLKTATSYKLAPTRPRFPVSKTWLIARSTLGPCLDYYDTEASAYESVVVPENPTESLDLQTLFAWASSARALGSQLHPTITAGSTSLTSGTLEVTRANTPAGALVGAIQVDDLKYYIWRKVAASRGQIVYSGVFDSWQSLFNVVHCLVTYPVRMVTSRVL